MYPGFHFNCLQIHTSYKGMTTRSQFALTTSPKVILMTFRSTVSFRWKQTNSSGTVFLLLRLRQKILSPRVLLVDVMEQNKQCPQGRPHNKHRMTSHVLFLTECPRKGWGHHALNSKMHDGISNLPYQGMWALSTLFPDCKVGDRPPWNNVI